MARKAKKKKKKTLSKKILISKISTNLHTLKGADIRKDTSKISPSISKPFFATNVSMQIVKTKTFSFYP
jgi:hypothetical protein